MGPAAAIRQNDQSQRQADSSDVPAASPANTSNPTRAGFLPVCMEHVPASAWHGLDIYTKTHNPHGTEEIFTHFCGQQTRFSQHARDHLAESGVKFVYIPIAQQDQFRRQTEAGLLELIGQAGLAASIKARIVYQTSVALVDEVLTDPDLSAMSPRLENVSRAVATLVLNDPTAFSHLFAAAHHDFYTAAHMVNVATGMVPLAYALGHHDPDVLSDICQAGLLHDIGKTYLPSELLNQSRPLTRSDWEQIKRHAELGAQYLSESEGIHPLCPTVALEHHERMDGSGYPHGLSRDEIHPVSRICAVVDSFDAMTSRRPFKTGAMSIVEATALILNETPAHYDGAVVRAWLGLVHSTQPQGGDLSDHPRRESERFRIDCPARLHVLEKDGETWRQRPALQITAFNISQGGLGILSPKPIAPAQRARVHLLGDSSLKRSFNCIAVRCRETADGWFEVGIQCEPVDDDAPHD
jgi:HD-GYP domain-containing protein (c-di-GMP phosphodiesterase class II)